MLQVNKVRIAGLSATLPKRVQFNADVAAPLNINIQSIVKATGIESRHYDENLCASDLCENAAKNLLKDIGWDKESIDVLIFLTQSPDYTLPATACLLQHKLGLSQNCAAFDINLGCSAYPYGLWVASSLLTTGFNRALILCGDVLKDSCKDASTMFLFGNAGTATALEKTEDPQDTMLFTLGTDGSKYDKLIVPEGSRNPQAGKTLYMDGLEVFTFSLTTVPKIFVELQLSPNDVDFIAFHQANKLILDAVAKKCKIPKEKVLINYKNRGNTSSASIPLVLIDTLRDRLTEAKSKFALIGFGVGFSWGGCVCDIGPICVSEVDYI